MIASPDGALPNELLDVEITVTNTGSFERIGIEMLLEMPDHLRALFMVRPHGQDAIACGKHAPEPGGRSLSSPSNP